jgi:hypothetical protein
MVKSPTPDDVFQIGRDTAVDLMLAILIAQAAAKSTETGRGPDLMQNMVDTLSRDIISTLQNRYPDHDLSDAVEIGFVGRTEDILDTARSILAGIHRIRRDESSSE